MMTAGPVWEELWDRLNDFYAVLVGQLAACNARLSGPGLRRVP